MDKRRAIGLVIYFGVSFLLALAIGATRVPYNAPALAQLWYGLAEAGLLVWSIPGLFASAYLARRIARY